MSDSAKIRSSFEDFTLVPYFTEVMEKVDAAEASSDDHAVDIDVGLVRIRMVLYAT